MDDTFHHRRRQQRPKSVRRDAGKDARPPSADVQRRSGILLHPASLPSPWGIGDLGPPAFAFLDCLRDTRQHLWQILPLGPSLGGSPYSTLSAIAGNPLLISLDLLARDGLLDADVAGDVSPSAPIQFNEVADRKMGRLRQACQRFLATKVRHEAFNAFCCEQSDWLDDYALFMSLKGAQHGQPWFKWPVPFAARDASALRQARRELADDFTFHQFTQYFFYSQWSALRDYARQLEIQIVGDIPFYMAHDSVDVWSHCHSFAVDPTSGEMLLSGGVPPDYFSETGQHWNVPVYRWRHLEESGFAWWVQRFRQLLLLVDIVRIDHFRGFSAYWQIPQGASTAVDGQWIDAPGSALFATLEKELGSLPIWAEDLGLITDDVEALRDAFDFPGMKVLQFAFDERGSANPCLPINFERNCVCYTGTHDNNTTRGWWTQLDASWKRRVAEYAGTDLDDEIPWALIRLASGSIANDAVFPWQDILGLGSEARLNVPGTVTGNWTWRFAPNAVRPDALERLARITEAYGRTRCAGRGEHDE